MKRVLYIIIASLQVLSVFADNTSATDSLLNKLKTAPHDTTRLQLLEELAINTQNSSHPLEYADLLFKEAKSQNNSHYICNAAYFHVIYYYNEEGNQDSIAKWVNLIDPIAQKIKYWKVYFNSKKLLINIYIYKRQYEYAYNEAMRMLEKVEITNDLNGKIAVYQCLANIYHETNRWKEEGEILEKLYTLLPQVPQPGAQINILCQLVVHSEQKKNYDNLKIYLDKIDHVLHEMENKNPLTKMPIYDQRLFLEIFYTRLYMGTNDLKKAKEHYEKAQTYITAQPYLPYLATYMNVGIEYFLKIKEYNTALSIADSAIQFVHKYNFGESDFAKETAYKADVLKAMGRYSEALPLYEKVTQMQDSLSTAVSNQQLEEIKDDYHLNQLLLEEGKLKGYIQIIILVIVGLILVLCITYALRVNRIRKALRMSEKETREAVLKTEEANEVKSHFLSNMSHAIRVPLNSVVGFSQLMASDAEITEEARLEYSNIIQKNTEELMLLVNNVLDLSRLEADMMKYQLSEYDIVQLCNDAVSATNMQNPNLHIDFQYSIESYNIYTDCNRMMQMIISTFTGPFSATKEAHNIHFSLDKNGEVLCFKVVNSPLAAKKNSGQEVSIRHEINRLLLKHFGGTYQVISDATAGPTILFTYPAIISQ